jgi:hypothetical protein
MSIRRAYQPNSPSWRKSCPLTPIAPMWWCWRCRPAACPSPIKSPARSVRRSTSLSSASSASPGYEELAMGAVATGGARVLNDQIVGDLIERIGNEKVVRVVHRQRRRSAPAASVTTSKKVVAHGPEGSRQRRRQCLLPSSHDMRMVTQTDVRMVWEPMHPSL